MYDVGDIVKTGHGVGKVVFVNGGSSGAEILVSIEGVDGHNGNGFCDGKDYQGDSVRNKWWYHNDRVTLVYRDSKFNVGDFWYTADVLEPAPALEAKIETQPTHPKFEDTVRKFSTGAVRDTSEGKPRMGLIPKDLLRRVSKLYTKGAEMYGADNWRKGQPKDATMDSLERHLEAYRRGETDEDHLSAVIWNAFSMMNVDEYLLEEHPELDFEFKYPKKKATSIDTILRRYREGR